MPSVQNDLVPSISPNVSDQQSIRGTPELMNISSLIESPAGSQQSVEMLLLEREQLYSCRNHLKAEVLAAQRGRNSIVDSTPDQELPQLYDKLKEELLQKTVIKHGRELIVKGEQLNRLTLSVLQVDGKPDEESLKRKRELDRIFEEYRSLASQVAKEHKEVAELRRGVENIKQENLGLLKKVREIYCEIDKKKQEREEELKTLTTDSSGKSVHEKLKSKLHMNAIQNNTLQGLILGSGLNWDQDPKLRQLMIDAGKNINI